MPNISAHMIVVKEVGKELGINSFDYFRGNLLPDIINSNDSHHRILSGPLLIPDINYFINNLDLTKDINIGYLVHILLDYHYLEEYIKGMYPDRNIFLDKDRAVYHDYDYLNSSLVKIFDLDINYLNKALSYFPNKNQIDKYKLKYNIDCLNLDITGKTKYLDIDSFANFLEDISKVISKEMMEYVSKHNIKRVYTR